MSVDEVVKAAMALLDALEKDLLDDLKKGYRHDPKCQICEKATALRAALARDGRGGYPTPDDRRGEDACPACGDANKRAVPRDFGHDRSGQCFNPWHDNPTLDDRRGEDAAWCVE